MPSRLSQDSRTSSESTSPRVLKTPSALDILNKNREKRNSEGKQREIRIPKRFSDQSESSTNGKKRILKVTKGNYALQREFLTKWKAVQISKTKCYRM